MSEQTKLILKIIGFIAIVIVLAWGIWAVFFRSPGASVVPYFGGQKTAGGGFPAVEVGPSGKVVDIGADVPVSLVPEQSAPPVEEKTPDAVASGGRTRADTITQSRAEYYTSTANGFNYYNLAEERFYRISRNGGEPVLLAGGKFPQVSDVAWSNSGDAGILSFPDGSNIYYNFATGERATLPPEAREFTFSPNDKQIAYEYMGQGVDDRWVVVAGANGEGRRVVQPIGREALNIKVDWSPNNQVVATYREPTSSLGEEVFLIGFSGENFLSLQTNGLGFEGKWSPKGKQILYSVYSEGTNYNPILHISGAEGDNVGLGNRSLRVQTWPDKCAFAGENTIYCAVPQLLEQGSGLFRELADASPDTIYKIDLVNNTSFPIAFPETENRNSFTIKRMSVSADQSELFFTDQIDGRIHRIRLR